MSDKMRLDRLLVEKQFFSTRQQAVNAIKEGRVLVDGEPPYKAGQQVAKEAIIEITAFCPFVGRGGLKLAFALEQFSLSVVGRSVIDVGASTGGFTDCVLQNGAERVIALDVGHGQLAEKLINHPRVFNLEGCNIRYVKVGELPFVPDLAVIDVSFISLGKVLPSVYRLLSQSGEVISLVKPQFEAGADNVGKRGLVRERNTHRQVLSQVWQSAVELGFRVLGLAVSPITGKTGNVEFLLYLSKQENSVSVEKETAIEQVMATVHKE